MLMSTINEPWDVTITLRDLSVALAEHVHAATVPTQRELNEWLHYITRAAPVYWALESACEDIVEDGASEYRIQALKQALTYAQGQVEYWHRKDRW
ncbi:hypothetical protein XEUV206_22250 [Xanthomonas euvesicatoria]|uniref:Uncharacterized protein n=2 Tax=Xanthomonas euvesicatoria TaxID=456327 RepID=Q3BZ67_XANE5|nr:hypothetical protein BHE83_15990 [Xanthomonas euvesicatoria pv. vesicatoria str. 85-10]APO92309.1 hypothetical protein BJD11_21835 [Xanthomonas euvesicatoria]KLB37702.1 hypothetical protein XEUV206_22250 [Xanthomonas euvesicatoria]CAJ21846.1 hypothetical protein XCV0215 [Xanthomonas euvesicatoria pv. vesicatoria str. 85-10]